MVRRYKCGEACNQVKALRAKSKTSSASKKAGDAASKS